MKKSQFLAILAAILVASFGFAPSAVYADGEASNEDTNQSTGDEASDNWSQTAGGNNSDQDGSGGLSELAPGSNQSQNQNPNTNQSSNNQSSSSANTSAPSSSTSSANTKPSTSTSTSSSSKPAASASTSASQKPQTTSSVSSESQDVTSAETVAEDATEAKTEGTADINVSQEEVVSAPEAGSESQNERSEFDLRLAGIVTAIAIVVFGLGSVIFVSLRRGRKSAHAQPGDPEEYWTTNDSEKVEDDFEFPAIDLDAEEKKIKTTKAAKAEKAAKTEKKSAAKSTKA